MPTKRCFLCASDEGVFLDITTENKQTFCTQFKICSLVKAPTSDQLPTKICHKCAYELNQCSTFLRKYKKAAKQKNYNRKNCCSLCFQQTDKEYTFDLKKENTLQVKSIDKIQQILTDESDTVQGNNILVCLSCRYTVDVLCDLKNLSNGIASKLNIKIEEDIDYSSFPKVQTTVISRKTTITEAARSALISRQSTDSDSDTMTRTRSKAKVNNKVSVKSGEQACKECHTPITADSGAHKNEKTGQIVCKVCWDKSRLNAKDIETQNSAETKVCKVFLEDVLSPAQKGKQVNEIEKNNENKKKLKGTAVKQLRPIVLSSDTDSDTRKQAEKRSFRSANANDSDNKDLPNKKAKRSAKETVKERESSPQTEPVSTRSTRSRKAVANNRHVIQSSDSDTSLSTNNIKRRKGSLTKHKKVTGSSLSDADVEIKRAGKRLKSILTRNSSTKGSDVNDESSTDDGVSKKKKLRFRNDSPIYIDLTTMPEGNERPRRNAVKRSASNAEKVTKSASVKKSPQKSEFEDKSDSDIAEEIKTYSCEECGVNYENRLVFLTHKLTHCKQPRLELEKVTVESKSNTMSQGTGEAADEQYEDQLESIGITVDDDEEEAELESTNLDNSVDANLSTISLVEEVAASPEKETPKDTVDTEIPSKELDNDQPTEKDDKDRNSLRDQRSRSLSTDKANAENVSELVEEENVEDISLTNIEDDQEEEGEEEKQVGQESEKKEKAQDGEVADSVDLIAGAVEEEKEAEKLDKEKLKETNSNEKLGGDFDGVLSEDADVDKLDSSKEIEADRAQGEAKLDSSDGSEEKNDTALLEKSEENQAEEKERRNSSDALEENLKDKEQSEPSDKSEANLVEDNLDSTDKSEEVRLNLPEKDRTDSSDRSEERRVTRTSRSVCFATLEEKGKQDSRENSREKSSSPVKSEERRSPRRSKSSAIARLEEDKRQSFETPDETDKLGSPGRSEGRRSPRRSKSSPVARLEEDKRESSETPDETDKLGSPGRSEGRRSPRRSKSSPVARLEDKRESSETPDETDKLGSPARSEERKSTRKGRSSMLAKIEEDQQDCPKKPEEKDKLGSSARCVERKCPKKSKLGLIGRINEDKEESPEKPEEEDERGSPGVSEEEKVTRNSKSSLFGKSEEKDEQDSSEKPKDKPISSEKLDKDESEEKRTDKDDVIVEINDDDSSDSVKEVCKNECNNEIDADDAEEVQVVEANDDNSCDVEEVCEQKDDDDDDDDEEVQCVKTICSDKSSDEKSNDAQTNGKDVVEVEVCTQPMPTSDSADVAAEIMQEVLDLASTEIQKRQNGAEVDGANDSDVEETLENISREVQNGGDSRP